jgi:adenylate kinase family enzyme
MQNNSQQQSSPLSPQMIDRLLKAKRIAVRGNQGAGKTTLALKLAEVLGVGFVEIYWKAKMTEEQEDQYLETKERTLKQETWIVDGDFGLLEFADTVILLDLPLLLCLMGVIKRSFKYMRAWNFGSSKTYLQIPAKIIERLLFFKDVIQYTDKPKMLAKLDASSRKQNKMTVITLKSRKEAQFLLESLSLAKSENYSDLR